MDEHTKRLVELAEVEAKLTFSRPLTPQEKLCLFIGMKALAEDDMRILRRVEARL